MHGPSDETNALPSSIRDLLDKLSGDELIAAQRYLEHVMDERGIDPYAHLDASDDDLDDDEREKLHAALDRGIAQADAGQTRPLSAVLDEMQRRR